MYKLSLKYLSGHPGKSYDETVDVKIYLRTGAYMCPPEIRNVHGKHISFVTAEREFFYKQRRPDSILKSNIMLHFTRVYTVCYSKKEFQVQKYNILEKFT